MIFLSRNRLSKPFVRFLTRASDRLGVQAAYEGDREGLRETMKEAKASVEGGEN